MLFERKGERVEETYTVEFKNVHKDFLPWLEEIIWENNCRIDKKEWKSKYNSYVIYDYEPFCSEGFEVSVIVTAPHPGYLHFIRFLYESKIDRINYLNHCILV